MLLFDQLNNSFLYANLHLQNKLSVFLDLLGDDVVFLFLNLKYTIFIILIFNIFFKHYIKCYFTSDGIENNVIRIIERENVILCLMDIDFIFYYLFLCV